MLKLIHTADLHLGSQMDAHMPQEKVKLRRAEIRSSFFRMVELAKREGVRHILLAGDIFDSERAPKADKELFYNIIKGSPEITFYYLRGNHDLSEDYAGLGLSNLVTFTDEWSSHELGEGVVLHGIEMTESNCKALYKTLSTDKSKTNIVMLHGQAASTTGNGLIHLPSLTGKNISYLALGHVHSYSSGRLDADGVYAYSGCLEGRGFDECGEKGFISMRISDGKLEHEFIPHSQRVIKSTSFDVGGCDGAYSIVSRILSMGFGENDIVRIELVGDADFDLSGIADNVTKMLEPYLFFVRVKNSARQKIDLSAAECELSLRGEFIRTVMRSSLSESEKNEVISLGIRALSGEEIQ